MRLQIPDSSEKIVAGGGNIQTDVMVREKTDHGSVACRRDSVLNLVKFQALYGMTDIACGSPFADMRF